MEGLNYRITTAGLCIKENKVLIGKREDKGSIACMWEFPGGKSRYSETVEDTLKREFKEELGVEIEVGEEVANTEFVNKDTHYFLKAHRVFLKGDIKDLTLTVHTELRWESLSSLKNYNFANSDKKIIGLLIDKFGDKI